MLLHQDDDDIHNRKERGLGIIEKGNEDEVHYLDLPQGEKNTEIDIGMYL